MSVIVADPPEPRDVQDFRFKQLRKLQVHTCPETLPTDPVSLLTLSNKYGLVIVGCPTEIRVIRTVDVLVLNEDEDQRCTDAANYPYKSSPLPSAPSHVTLSCDDLTLIVCIRKNDCCHALIYDLRAFVSKGTDIGPFNEVRLSANPEAKVLDIVWNPGELRTAFAAVMSDGSVGMFELKEKGIEVHTLPASSGARAICWSPKGKQLVVGKADGIMTQYKPDLKEVKSLPAPAFFENPVTVVNILWLSNYMFVVAYKDTVDQDQRPGLVFVSAPKGSPVTFTNFDDICFSSGQGRQPHFQYLHQPEWGVILCMSANAMEVGILGLKAGGKSGWEQWNLDDSARAELPLTSDSEETFPTGMAFDTTPQKEIPWGENQTIPAMPLLYLLSTAGLLCPFHVINFTEGAASLTKPPETLTSDGERKPQIPIQVGFRSTAGTTGEVPQIGFQSATGNTGQAPQFGLQSAVSNTGQVLQVGFQSTSGSTGQVSPIGYAREQKSGGRLNLVEKFKEGSSYVQPSSSSFCFKPAALALGVTAGQVLPTASSVQQEKPSAGLTGAVVSGPSSVITSSSASGATTVFNVSQPDNQKVNVSTSRPIAVPTFAASTPVKPFSTIQPSNLTAFSKPVVSSSTGVSKPQFSISQPLPTKPIQPVSISPLRTTETNESVPLSGLQSVVVPVHPKAVTPTPPTQPAAAPAEDDRRAVESSKVGAVQDSFAATIKEEMRHFEKELRELKQRANACNFQVGVEQERHSLQRKTEAAERFCRDVKDATAAQNGEIHALKSQTIEAFAWVEEAKSREIRNKDHRYLHLLRSRSLDPLSKRRLSEVRCHYQYLEQQLGAVNHRLDQDWHEFQEKKNKSRKKIQLPSFETVYHTLLKNNTILSMQSQNLEQLISDLKQLRVRNITSMRHTAMTTPVSSSSKGDAELSKLAETLLGTKPSVKQVETETSPVKSRTKNISPEKEALLRTFLGQRQVPRVRSTKPASLLKSRFVVLNLSRLEEDTGVEDSIPPTGVQQYQTADDNCRSTEDAVSFTADSGHVERCAVDEAVGTASSSTTTLVTSQFAQASLPTTIPGGITSGKPVLTASALSSAPNAVSTTVTDTRNGRNSVLANIHTTANIAVSGGGFPFGSGSIFTCASTRDDQMAWAGTVQVKPELTPPLFTFNFKPAKEGQSQISTGTNQSTKPPTSAPAPVFTFGQGIPASAFAFTSRSSEGGKTNKEPSKDKTPTTPPCVLKLVKSDSISKSTSAFTASTTSSKPLNVADAKSTAVSPFVFTKPSSTSGASFEPPAVSTGFAFPLFGQSQPSSSTSSTLFGKPTPATSNVLSGFSFKLPVTESKDPQESERDKKYDDITPPETPKESAKIPVEKETSAANNGKNVFATFTFSLNGSDKGNSVFGGQQHISETKNDASSNPLGELSSLVLNLPSDITVRPVAPTHHSVASPENPITAYPHSSPLGTSVPPTTRTFQLSPPKLAAPVTAGMRLTSQSEIVSRLTTSPVTVLADSDTIQLKQGTTSKETVTVTPSQSAFAQAITNSKNVTAAALPDSSTSGQTTDSCAATSTVAEVTTTSPATVASPVVASEQTTVAAIVTSSSVVSGNVTPTVAVTTDSSTVIGAFSSTVVFGGATESTPSSAAAPVSTTSTTSTVVGAIMSSAGSVPCKQAAQVVTSSVLRPPVLSGHASSTVATTSVLGGQTSSTVATNSVFGGQVTPATATTPASSSVFGGETATTVTTAATSSSPIFGGHVTSTTATISSSSSVFGGQATSAFTFGKPLLFGSQPAATATSSATTTSTSAFGIQAAASSPGSLFGKTAFFGKPVTSVHGFGQQTFGFASSGSAFGQPTSTTGSAFGQPTSTTGSAFGQPTSTTGSAFGQPSSTTGSAFGQPTSTSGSIFGGNSFDEKPSFPSFSAFGQQSQPASLFGQNTSPGFGQTGSNVFGQSPTSTHSGSLFGMPPQSTSTSGDIFGTGTGGGGFFSGLGGEPGKENASKNVFGGTTGFGSSMQNNAGIFGNRSTDATSPFRSPVSSGSWDTRTFSAGGGSVAESGFGGFNKSPNKSGGFGGSAVIGGSSNFSRSSFSNTSAFGESPTYGMSFSTDSPVSSSSGFSNFANNTTTTFGSLATVGTPSFGSLQPQDNTPTFGSQSQGFGQSGGFGMQQSSFGGRGNAFSTWR